MRIPFDREPPRGLLDLEERDDREHEVQERTRWPGKRTQISPQALRYANGAGTPGKIPRSWLDAAMSRSSGAPLPAALRARLERKLGTELSDVRIHTDEEAALTAEALGADAYAVGKDIFFGRGKYDPSSIAGQRLVAHEVAHTQQRVVATSGDEVEVSSPSDSHEHEADAFADSFVHDLVDLEVARTPRGRRQAERALAPAHDGIVRPAEGPRLVAPVGVGISRWPGGPVPAGPSPGPSFPTKALLQVDVPDVTLFKGDSWRKDWPLLDKSFDLANGAILLGGVPVSYEANAALKAGSWLAASYQDGRVEGIKVTLSAAEKAAYTAGGLPFPIGPPGSGELARWAILKGDHTAEGMARVAASAEAGMSAEASVSGGVHALGVFGGGVTGSLGGSAKVKADARANAFARFVYAGGVVKVKDLILDSEFDLGLHLNLTATAGVYVELKFPHIPIITDLSSKLSSWPIVGWVVPDLKKWRWRKDFTKSWTIVDYDKVKKWKKQWKIVANGNSPVAGAFSVADEDTGYDVKAALKDALDGNPPPPEKSIPKEDPGPDDKLKDGASPGAVAANRHAAKAQVKSAREAVKRELAWNATELTKTKAAVAKETKKKPATAGSGPPALAIPGGGGGTPLEKKQAALVKREENLKKADDGAVSVDKRVDEIKNVAESATDGPSRNQAAEAYGALGGSADKLGQAVGGYGDNASDNAMFKRPAAVEEAKDAAEEAERAEAERKLTQARRAADEAYELVKEEEFWAENEIELVAPFPEAADYREKVRQRFYNSRWMRQRAEKLQDEIGLVEKTYPRPKDQVGAYDIAISHAAKIKKDFKDQGKRPDPPWDKDYVTVEGRKLMLLNQWRNGKKIRSEFYPHDYAPSTKTWRDHKIGPITNVGGVEYWTYDGALSPRGDNLWKRNAADERPTIDHTMETVGAHWDRSGRLIRWDGRVRYYNGFFLHDANLRVVPQKLNSSKGATEDPKVSNFEVNVTFRGKK